MPIPVEWIAMSRMAFGPRAGDVERVRAMGLAAYIDEQIRSDAADPQCEAALKSATLHIEYEAGKDDKGNQLWKSCKEDRPLRLLSASSADLWKLTDGSAQLPGEERQRALQEVKTATWLRAVHSRWQLREVLVDFWHNHFNVNSGIDDERVALMWPVYDRDVIRKHCLGNFRQFLEAVATSVPMLLYLNNASSKASPANENFGRELFELHTLGAPAYFNHLYNRWREVPGATEGKPIGYIDQDVYESARSFTGWTIADGSDTGRGDKFPNTGAFHYYDGWHDPYQKRVLGVEFEPNQPPMSDGRKVLDLLATHPATAQYVCTKLCRRLVSDNPPAGLVDRAAAVFTANRDAPDQIAQTVKMILLSDEFASTWGEKVKRPFELIVSFLRITGATARPDNNLFYLAEQMGQRMFAWPSPTGHPDRAGYWTGTNAMLGRWNAPVSMFADDFSGASFRLWLAMPADVRTPRQMAAFWAGRMLGPLATPEMIDLFARVAARDRKLDAPLDVNEKEMIDRIHALVGSIAMTPQFQAR
jgi:uncharacterized protein (DUF1800 family)